MNNLYGMQLRLTFNGKRTAVMVYYITNEHFRLYYVDARNGQNDSIDYSKLIDYIKRHL